MGEHFGGGILFARRIGIFGGDHMGFGNGQRDAIGNRIGGRIAGCNAALTLAARRFAARTFSACAALTFTCGSGGFRRSARFARRTLTARFPTTRRQQAARQCRAKAKLGPEFESAVHYGVSLMRPKVSLA
jgi:hypothetical protein